MFVRPCWQPVSSQDAIELIAAQPWALLLSNGTDVPLATNLPLLIEAATAGGEELVLVGHIARGNEHARLLATNPRVLAVFEGPWSYVTASWYPQRNMPSTYYYTAVHCHGTVELQTEEELDASLEVLTQRMESQYPQGWQTSEIPRSEITRRFAGIVGFRIRVDRLEAKFKLGQDEPLVDALAVADRLDEPGSFANAVLAEMIRRQNRARSSS